METTTYEKAVFQLPVNLINLYLCRTLEVPIIGALKGPVIGAGACLAIAGCDMRVAEYSTKIAFNFLKIGLHPGAHTYTHTHICKHMLVLSLVMKKNFLGSFT